MLKHNDDFANIYSLLQQERKPIKIEDRYEIHQLLGSGGMAKVYRAYDVKLQRLIAIKILSNKNTLPQKEAQSIAKLHHQNIVTVYDFGSNEQHSYITMEYIVGQNLQQYLKENSPSIPWSVELIKNVANAIYHAHHQGVIHRDLKPANIMLPSGTPKIMDFGLAKSIDDGTSEDIIRGTLPYMAPEQIDVGTVNHCTDIYAIGLILYELLTGHNPFADITFANSVKILDFFPPAPRTINKAVPRALEKICLKCLEKKQQNRYQSARVLAKDLDKVLHRKTRLLIYIPWVLFLATLTLYLVTSYTIEHSPPKLLKKPQISQRDKSQQTKGTMDPLPFVMYAPIFHKYQIADLISSHDHYTEQMHAKLLLNFAMMTTNVDKRNRLLNRVIQITTKLVNENSKDNISRFLRYLSYRISPSLAVREKQQQFFVANDKPQDAIEHYSNAAKVYIEITQKPRIRIADLQQVLQNVHEGCDKYPAFIPLYILKGKILQQVKNTTQLLECYQKALEYEPFNPFTLHARAKFFYDTENLEAAMADIKKSIDHNITIASTWYLYGRLLKEKKQYGRALTSLTRALDLGYLPTKCYFQRQSIYYRLGRYQEVIDDCSVLLNLEKRKSYYLVRSKSYLQLSHYEKAITDLEAAYELAPKEKGILLKMAEVYGKMGEEQKAQQAIQKFMKKE